jgi:hypothetical protein
MWKNKKNLFGIKNLNYRTFFTCYMILSLLLLLLPAKMWASSFPPSIHVEYNTNPATSLNVLVEGTPENQNGEVKKIGLALGTYTTSTFPANSIVQVVPDDEGYGSYNFTITKNGTYTAYAYENKPAVYVFTITNILPPVEDPLSATLTISKTDGKISVMINVVNAQGGVQSVKWASGNQTLSYFLQNGTTLAEARSFQVYSNGTYSVYLKDAAGNQIVRTINVKDFYQYYYINGRLNSVEVPGKGTIRYTYDNNGNLLFKKLVAP